MDEGLGTIDYTVRKVVGGGLVLRGVWLVRKISENQFFQAHFKQKKKETWTIWKLV